MRSFKVRMFLGGWWYIFIYFHTFSHVFPRIQLFEAGSKFLCVCFLGQLYCNKNPSAFCLQRILVAQVPHPQHVFAPCQSGTWINLRPVNLQLTGVASTQLGSLASRIRCGSWKFPSWKSNSIFFFCGCPCLKKLGDLPNSLDMIRKSINFQSLNFGTQKKHVCFLLRYELRPCPMNTFGVSDGLFSLSKKWASHLSIDSWLQFAWIFGILPSTTDGISWLMSVVFFGTLDKWNGEQRWFPARTQPYPQKKEETCTQLAFESWESKGVARLPSQEIAGLINGLLSHHDPSKTTP